ncbi:sensor domain-containing diguanylate cyclase [Vibrio panuliri]|uniref:diguanylate cyclase n=1 Tax=Vibrio panuliri TaxID=1381081 RepID=A0ABX3FGI1_9VIBR|nr:diguanylate cyclase [Vibrio panuliri]KAB1460127.1 diguanylate cyclase [Vibrio panuliri]OLQ89761.1 diguanylate cyclase [Vibrio panuliri]
MIKTSESWIFESVHLHGFEMLFAIVLLVLFVQLYYRFHRQVKRLIEDSPVPMMLVESKSGKLLISNAVAARVLGVRRVGRYYLLPGTLNQSFIIELMDYFTHNNSAVYKIDWPLSANQSVRVEVYARATDYHGKRCWLFYITPYKQNADDMTKQVHSLSVIKSAFDNLSELIFVKGTNGEKLFTNRAFDHFWGERFDEGMHEITGVDKGRASHRHWTVDLSGRSCLLETHQSLLMSPQGEPLGMLGISHDVTDWHDIQRNLRDEMEKRRDTEVALAQSDTILQNILEASPDSIGIFNQSLIYQACNKPFVKKLGISDVNDLIGRRLQDVISAEAYKKLSESDHQVLKESVSQRYIEQVVHSNGEMTWYDVVKSPFRDPASGTNGVLVMARDVSERYLAEQKLAEANQELERLSFIDGLTQIANRRRFDEQLDLLWHLHIREQRPLTIMLCDIDNFKGFNDLYGHQQGDEALIGVAQAFKRVITRSSDCVARYGGEEFAFILPNTTVDGAKVLAQRIHTEVESLAIPHQGSQVKPYVTVSIGFVTFVPQPSDSPDSMVALADSALYRAKAQGRNQTCLHHTSSN